jgi:hypothetical protein
LLGGSVWGPWDLLDTTQPYKPNIYDQNSSAGPTLNIWEFPNNGADSWSFSSDQMIDRQKANYNPDIPLEQKRMLTYLSHPEWYPTDKPKMERVFDYTSNFLYKENRGPVIFITLDEANNIWNLGD